MPYPNAFAGTWYNYDKSDLKWHEAWSKKMDSRIQYICGQEETCPSTGRLHIQMYVQMKSPSRFMTVVNLLTKSYGGDFHLDKAIGSDDHNRTYCSKDGGSDFHEFGVRQSHPGYGRQGARTDSSDAYRKIVDEGMSASDVIISAPEKHGHHYKYLFALEDIALQRKYRDLDAMPRAEWWFGATGTGKTRAATELFKQNPEDTYWWSYDNGWWDNYKGQGTIIFNELRTFPYSLMLEITDRNQCFLSRRGRARVPCMAHTIIVTSSLRPEEVYNNLAANDKIEQLLRRFRVINFLSYENRVEILSPN